MKKLKYGLLGINCVNSDYPPNWMVDDECCQCNFECKLKVFEIQTLYEYVITKDEYKKLLKNKQLKS